MDSKSPLLSSTECMDEDIGTRLKFENASDAIFASLFLKTDGVSWSSFGILLSAIRNTSFDAKQVTFKDSSDFAARLAQIRERDLMRQRKAEIQVAGLPEVILDGVVDALGDDLCHKLDLARKETHGFYPSGFRFDSFFELYLSWKSVLVKCALVHSTWLAPARRVLGLYHHSNPNTLNRLVKSPWIGRWTLALQIPLIGESTTLPSKLSLLRPLFNRLPNLQRLQFTAVTNRPFINEAHMLSSMADSLRALPSLVELSLNVWNNSAPLIETLSAISLPNLRILRLLEVPLQKFNTLDLPDQFLPVLTAFPSLNTIDIDCPTMWDELIGIIWTKTTNGFSRDPEPPKFIASEVRMETNNWPDSDNGRQWRSSLPVVQSLDCFCLGPGAAQDIGNSIVDELRDIFTFCTTLRTLRLCVWTSVGYETLSCIPTTVEELKFTFPSFSGHLVEHTEGGLTSAIEKWDVDLSKALRLGRCPVSVPLEYAFCGKWST